jgi:hypothetical protein
MTIKITDKDINSQNKPSDKIVIDGKDLNAQLPSSYSFPLPPPVPPRFGKDKKFPIGIIAGVVGFFFVAVCLLAVLNGGCDVISDYATTVEANGKFPNELRVVARCLAEELHPNLAAAMKKQNQQEARLGLHAQKLDLAKIKSKNKEIKYLADEALIAVTDTIKHLETIDNLPKPNGWKSFGAGFLDGFLIGSGIPPTGISVKTALAENAKEEAINNELKGLINAIKKAEVAQRLLPRVMTPYSAEMTQSKNGERINVAFHEFPCFYDCFSVENCGQDLSDCLIEVKITGEYGDVATSVFFVETWKEGTTLYAICTTGTEFNGEIIMRQTVTHVNQMDVTILSPKYSTVIQYQYGQSERDADYATVFKDVRLENGIYQKKEPGILTDYQRSFKATMQGFDRLPPCKFTVYFKKAGKKTVAIYDEDSGWTAGNSWKITPGNDRLTFEPDEVTAEISFPRTNFTIKRTWNCR